MAMSDTYIELKIDPTYPKYAALSATQLRGLMLHIPRGNISFAANTFGQLEGAAHLGGIAGSNLSRWTGGAKDIFVGYRGASIPFMLWYAANHVLSRQLAEYVRKGNITAIVRNKGNLIATTDVGSAWRDGFELLPEELNSYTVYPRLLRAGIVAAETRPSDDIEDFVYLPKYTDSKAVVEITGTGQTVEITLWVYNPATGKATVADIQDTVASADPRRIVFDLKHGNYVMPVISAMAAGTADIHVGCQILRAT